MLKYILWGSTTWKCVAAANIYMYHDVNLLICTEVLKHINSGGIMLAKVPNICYYSIRTEQTHKVL